MEAVPSPRRAGVIVGLCAIAIACVTALLLATPGSEHYATIRGVTSAVAFVIAGVLIGRGGDAEGWPGARFVAAAFLLSGGVAAILAVSRRVSDTMAGPPLTDLVLLALIVPFSLAARDEFSAHFEPRDRREVIADVSLLALSLAATGYVVIRPVGASTEAALSAATYAIVAAAIIAISGALALWAPSRGHLLAFVGFCALALATLRFGAAWVTLTDDRGPAWVGITFASVPLALAAVYLLVPHEGRRLRVEGSTRIVRPVLTSVTVIAACVALSVVASLDDARGIAGTHSTVILLILGVAIALRILSNQLISAEAFGDAKDSLSQQRIALSDTDAALDRLREANESLRRSEEHLRLVFDAAVDGFVELDHRRLIMRVNHAFATMVALDPIAVVGMAWTALAAVVDGADPGFAGLLHGGQATIDRSDGLTLHLESTASEIPTDPPQTLLLVRDVSAAKVADQTIRSLFQFLQDRDEDRTRLLRRSNAAIEQERNRIARDLHDGPVQGVSAASLSLEAALLMIKAGDVERGTEVLVKIREELAGEADALRQLMSGLRPPVLEERGLIPALRETLLRFGTDTGVVTAFEGELQFGIPRDVETLAYRIVQEALSNVGKHAAAATVTVLVNSDAGQLRIEIEDDGRGFETNQARDYLRSGRVGLASMRERVELASGTFNLRSTPGRGTVVTALIPVDEPVLAVPGI
ncbi:MAG: PAS domain-containing sensor histidine kinase [Actinomycetota bacterium]